MKKFAAIFLILCAMALISGCADTDNGFKVLRDFSQGYDSN